MHHSFDTEHARLYGLAEAVLIGNFQFWILKNRANGENLIDGRTWTYNSVRAWAEIFPYFSFDQVRRGLQSLVKQGVLLVGNFNASKVDRTKWYAFADEATFLPGAHVANLPNGRALSPNASGASADSLIKTDVNQMGGRAARLPPDWLLPKSWGELALARFPHWTPDYVRDIVAVKFRNHWVGKGGKDAAKLDWKGTWENWCINEERDHPFKNPNVPALVAAGQWWLSNSAIDAKGAALGLVPAEGEAWPFWRDRVFLAAGDGPWIGLLQRQQKTAVHEPRRVGVSGERQKLSNLVRPRAGNSNGNANDERKD